MLQSHSPESLIREDQYNSDPANEYLITYEYDQGGNRTRKVRSLPGCDRIETVYYYDVEDPEAYGSFNNRLMYYETLETCRGFEDYGHKGGCGTSGDAPISTTWYDYDPFGKRRSTRRPATRFPKTPWTAEERGLVRTVGSPGSHRPDL